jgi:pyridoxamine 5'-phosphate oxidase
LRKRKINNNIQTHIPMNNKDISNLRINYERFDLTEENVPESPFELFGLWFKDAVNGGIKEPNAMVLSTIADQKPHARVVLLKGFSTDGFEYYTNYRSHKGNELAQNPFSALTFFYDHLERQIRIEGSSEKLSPEVSDAYFWSRPRGSQIGAWVSKQSEVIPSREILEERLAYFEEKFKDTELIPRPEHWGGFLLKPESIEFWQGRPSRLHDRLLYQKNGDNWKISRLSP